MVDFLEPILPLVHIDPDMNRADLERACAEALLRASILEEWLTGARPVDDFNDLLREADADPDEFWDEADRAVDAFIAAGIVPDTLEFLPSGLVIPRH